MVEDLRAYKAAGGPGRDDKHGHAGAQADGILTTRYPAGTLLALVLQIVATFTQMPAELAEVADVPDADSRAALVEAATRALLEG